MRRINSKFQALIVIISILLGGFLSSCSDYLAQPPSATFPLDSVFSNITSAERVLDASYALMPYGFPHVQNAASSYALQIYWSPVADICDEADNAWTAASSNINFNNAALNPTLTYQFLEDKWAFNFQAIRNAYLFLENIERVPQPRPAQTYIDRLKGEALGIIGIKYFEMFKRYGGLPWINKANDINEGLSFERLTISETVDSIADVLDRAAVYLPANYDETDFGRVNKITVLATKARLLLYAASPLFNTSTPYMPFSKPQLICYGNYDIKRWEKAAIAAKAAIDLAESSGYKLINTGRPDLDYTTAVKAFPPLNTEIIQGTRICQSLYDLQGLLRWKPYSKTRFPGGIPCIIPSQNVVDMYEKVDGTPTTPDYFTSSSPFLKGKLDARFYQTILYHGSQFDIYSMDMRQNNQGEAVGDNCVKSGLFYTGYYCLKFVTPSYFRTKGTSTPSFWPYLRLSDLYLMYAEALNEYDPTNPDILIYVNLIRKRAGIARLPVLPSDDTQEGMRSRIKNERAVEFMFEGHRYFDLKRWKMGEVLGSPIYGMNTIVNGSVISFQRFKFEDRLFPHKMYLYPFMSSEVDKSKGMIQNPGY